MDSKLLLDFFSKRVATLTLCGTSTEFFSSREDASQSTLGSGRLSSVRLVMASKRDYVARQRDRIEKVEQLARRDKQNLYRIASFERLKDKGK